MPIATPNPARPAFPPLVVAAVFALAAAIIALGVVGFASAQTPPAAPTNVTVLASGEGFVIGWDASDTATSHWVAWMSDADYEKYRADDWTKALKYEPVPSGNTYTISSELLVTGADYWIIVGSVSGASAVAWGEWQQATALQVEPGPEPTDDELTRAYVMDAIAHYDANGLDATIARYNDPSSVEGERMLYLIDAETTVLLASPIPYMRGLRLTDFGLGDPFLNEVNQATEQGQFSERLWANFNTGQQEPVRMFMARKDGLVFMSAHYIVKENVADTTKEYVNRAIRYYDEHGREAMVAHYNTRASFDGQFYLFMMDESDVYLVHPFIPRLVGTDLKNVVGRDKDGNEGYELGKEIAKADENGIWVEYLWPNPETLKDEKKVTWAVRHDGKIFASGYYTGREEPGAPAWATTDPREYTEQYVNQAIARYQEYGLESVEAYYNSVASFEGEFYLFATDPDDTYIIHPVFPDLIGTDLKDVARAGFELGKELAKATNEQGVWVEYLWPHPATLSEAPKVAYAKRYDGYLFASGYYPLPDDPEAATREYIQQAIDLYESDGRDAMVARYNSPEGADGQWYLYVIDRDGKFIVSGLFSHIVGTNAADFESADVAAIGSEMLQATAAGRWFSYLQPNIQGAGEVWINSLAIRHADGLIFVSGYRTPYVAPEPEPTDDDALTRAYVEAAIARYAQDGLDATVAYYNDLASIEGERALMILSGDDQTVLASAPYNQLVGSNSFTGPGAPLGALISQATPEGHWISDIVLINPATGQRGRARYLVMRHDGLIFGSGHFPTREEYTKNYVQQAIAFYQREGRAAAIDFYNNPDNVDGEFYLFLIGADDLYLAHPVQPHLIGTDIKDVIDSTGYELGREIAKATAAGHWVDYLWPNPVTRVEEPKSAWVVRHDGLIFASGYYRPDPNAAPPAWQNADPREYTVTYVENAIARYERDGLEAFQNYYNSVGSFEGQWYLFATDANDHYILHPLFSRLIGTDIKDLPQKDSAGNDLGRTIAAATAGGAGIWVEYDWPHPFTLQEAPKVAYVVRHEDGTLFASGYYPAAEDPRAYTQQYVADAIARYQRDGREATIAYYNSPESIDRQWSLMMVEVTGADGIILASAVFPNRVGTIITEAGQLGVTEAGMWFPPHPVDNPLAPELNFGQEWAVLHDGIIFSSGYFYSG